MYARYAPRVPVRFSTQGCVEAKSYRREVEVSKVARTYRLPWRREVLHNSILGGCILADMLEPRVPFGGNLSSVVVVLEGRAQSVIEEAHDR